MANPPNSQPYVLGLDLGVASIGWALVGLDDHGDPSRIIRAGVHLFEAGVDGGKQDAATAMESGKEKSKALPRRNARQQRRQIWRRAYRKRSLLKRLIRFGLLPKPQQRLASPEEIDAYIKQIDHELRVKWEEHRKADHRQRQLLPYRLRAAALDGPLEAHEVGRALYHLAQRRGFLSNRKTDQDDSSDEEKNTGKVKAGISELQKMMVQAGARTLGAFFEALDPSDPESSRIRGRWTARSMYEDEFRLIWETQAVHHPQLLTDEARESIHEVIFHQRSLKSQRHLIGRCSLIPSKRRAPIADRLFQRYRLLQKVNDLEVFLPDSGEVRALQPLERQKAIKLLSAGDATFAKLRRAVGLPRSARFNFEEGGEKRLPGMRTDEKLRIAFGERWEELSEQEKNAAVEDCLSFERADAMQKRGRDHWGLSAEGARAFACAKLEEGYAAFCRAAIRQLLPKLEAGVQVQIARKEIFPESFTATEPLDTLPPLREVFKDPLSPAVSRALSELRGVSNAMLRRYGKPQHVRIELARDLKKGRKRRDAISKQIAARRRIREDAAARLLSQYPDRGDNQSDILKVLLADECGWKCPYTGREFGWNDLFGVHPTIDIEHIWPYSRTFDNSFLNKTLCCNQENRSVKRNRTPAEAYSGERLDQILQRVTRFRSDAASVKLQRFKADAIPADFANRHLSESRYISRKAAEYIALLFGGLSDDEHKRRVHATSGGLTHILRQQWRMHSVLSDRDEKNRSDHRHHALDAIAVALTTPRTVQVLEKAAIAADDSSSGRLFADVPPPFDCFIEECRRAVGAIVVSQRQNRKVRGKFHKDTIYSRPLPREKRATQHRIRRELHVLKEKELDAIVDPRTRNFVRAAYAQRKREGAMSPAQAFSERRFLPQRPDGVRIRRARIYTSAKPEVVGTGNRDRKNRVRSKQRRVDLQANHHTVIMARLNKDGSERTWVDEPVSLFDAMERVKKARQLGNDAAAVVARAVPQGCSFKFTLAKNEYVEMDRRDGDDRGIYRVLNVSGGFIEVREHWDGRTRKELKETGTKREITRGSDLFNRRARKVLITYLGEVKNAGG